MTFDVFTIRAAAEHVRAPMARTPVLESPPLNELGFPHVLVKAELLQLTGQFKIRGVLDRTLTSPAQERSRRLVEYSMGNHNAMQLGETRG